MIPVKIIVKIPEQIPIMIIELNRFEFIHFGLIVCLFLFMVDFRDKFYF